MDEGVDSVTISRPRYRELLRLARQVALHYGRNGRFAPGSDIECNCGKVTVKRRGDVYYCWGPYYVSEYFIVARCCDDRIRHGPEIIPGGAVKGHRVGVKRIIY